MFRGRSSLNPDCFLYFLDCPFLLFYPSSNDSRMIPSGESGMFSIADTSFTPFSFRVCLWMVISYLSLENRSSLYTVGKNTAAIKEYIANQLKQDKESDQLSLFDMRDPFKGGK